MREDSSEMMEDEELEKKRWSPYLPGQGHGGAASATGGNFDSGRGAAPSTPAPPPFSDQVLDNVLENVLQFLTSRRDRNAASLVCRSWCRAEAMTRREVFVGNCYAVTPGRAAERFRCLRALVLKGKPRFSDFNLMPAGWGANFKPWVTAMAAGCPALERVYLKRMSVTDADLSLLARSFPNFQDLSLICCENFSTAGLAAVAENCRHLRVLDLIENDVRRDENEKTDWISSFPATTTSLESLVFESFVWPVSFEALEALVARSPGLRRLRVNQHISVIQLRRLMMRAPQLTHLGTGSFTTIPEVDNGAVELDVADLRSSFSASKSLVCLSGFQLLEEEFIPAIYPVCAKLTSLNLSYADISSEQLISIIVQCHNLRTFWVLDTVGDDGLQAVAETCKDLRELRVFPFDPTEDSVGSVSDIGLVAISEGCPKLRSILYFCQRMTNAAVVTMSRNCPELVVFRLCIMGRRRPDHTTGGPMDEGFGAIVMNCKKLTRLAVSGLLTDRAFEYIGGYGKLVRTLSVAFAGDTDSSLRYVLQGCPKLQKLEIRDSPFGNEGLLSGIHHYYNMRFLWMSTCELTLWGCKEVARRLPRLVVEAIQPRREDNDDCDDETDKPVGTLYLYRSLAGPRNDAPSVVKIL